LEFEASLGYIVRSCLKKQNKNKEREKVDFGSELWSHQLALLLLGLWLYNTSWRAIHRGEELLASRWKMEERKKKRLESLYAFQGHTPKDWETSH
jgi:hypothetical protein